MARLVVLPSEADFAAWRSEARALIQADITPEHVVWSVGGSTQSGDLFASAPSNIAAAPTSASAPFTVPARFLDLAPSVICHSDPERFALLYRLLWRLRADKHLMEVSSDADVRLAETLAKAVRRDKHKMTAFVRFREVTADGGSVWIAWFEPQHHIVEATAPFFMRRFTGMTWSILTPRLSAHWNGTALSFTAGATRADAPTEDALEDHWRTYFASIFNPARLNTDAMQREMPKKYWKNMPETALIPDLVRSARERTRTMLANPPPMPRVTVADREAAMAKARVAAEAPDNAITSLRALNAQLDGCRRCPLYRDATQAVPGAGARSAEIILIGEQPGDQEDLQGKPFVGPAGRLLDQALDAAGLPRTAVYVTNAVKHFKFEPRGKRRLHMKPNTAEIDACRWWLSHEIKLIRPKLIVALGATAASSLLQRPVKIGAERGQAIALPDGATGLITVHPSYLLRLPDAKVAEMERKRFIADLEAAVHLARDLGASLEAA